MLALWHPAAPFWHFILRGGVVYISVLLLLRVGGKRQIGQMGAGEFVAILLISNAVQNAMNGGDNSIAGGLLLAMELILLSTLVAYLTYKSKKWETWIQGKPRLIIHQGHVIHENMEKEWLNLRELKTILRRQGIHNLSDIHEAVLESDGSVSVIKKSEIISSQPPGP